MWISGRLSFEAGRKHEGGYVMWINSLNEYKSENTALFVTPEQMHKQEWVRRVLQPICAHTHLSPLACHVQMIRTEKNSLDIYYIKSHFLCSDDNELCLSHTSSDSFSSTHEVKLTRILSAICWICWALLWISSFSLVSRRSTISNLFTWFSRVFLPSCTRVVNTHTHTHSVY